MIQLNDNGTKPKRAVIYTRVSSKKQEDDRISIVDQQLAIESYARDNGIAVVDRYTEGRSASEDRNRPVFDDMIYRCETAGDVDLILVHSLSRFYRDQVAFCVIERRLNRRGIAVVSITQPIEDSMARRVVMIADELYRDELSKHSTRTLFRNAMNGNHNGKAPFGYQLVEAEAAPGYRGKPRKKLAPHPLEAEIVVEIFELAAGLRGLKPMGAHRIANRLNEAGKLMRGRAWRMDKVVYTLHSTTYKGLRYWGRSNARSRKLRPMEQWIQVPCPALVSEELFDKVQALMHARTTAPRERSVPRHVKALLVGPLVCGVCGERYWTVTSNSGATRHYLCRIKARRRGHCTGPRLPMEPLDKLVLGALVEEVITPARIMLVLERLRNTSQASGSSLARKKARLNSISERLDRLYELAEKGLQDPILQNKIKRAQADREFAAHELRQEEELIENMFGKHTSIEELQDFCARLRRQIWDLSLEEKRAFVQLYVSSIIVTTDEIILTGTGDSLMAGVFGQMRSGQVSPNPWAMFSHLAANVGLSLEAGDHRSPGSQPNKGDSLYSKTTKLGLATDHEAWLYRVPHKPRVTDGLDGDFEWTTRRRIAELNAKLPVPLFRLTSVIHSWGKSP